MDEKAYRIRLIKILEILRQNTDEDHPMGTPMLIKKLAEMGIVCDRRTLYKDIAFLNKHGYEILHTRRISNEYYVIDRSFDLPELRILMDAVQAASFITPKKTEQLVDKIADLAGSHRAELLKGNVVKFNTTKSSNESIFYAVNEINTAIENGCKVSFEYFDYDEKHERVYRKGGKRYFVNPLATIFDDDNYYLVCYYGRHEGVVHYRIDRMDHVQMVPDQPIVPYKGEPLDLKHHKRTLFGMFQGDEQEVEFLADKSILDPIFDIFGSSIELTSEGDNKVRFKASVQLSPTFFGWCLSFGDKLKVVGPKPIRKKVIQYIEKISGGYEEESEQIKQISRGEGNE